MDRTEYQALLGEFRSSSKSLTKPGLPATPDNLVPLFPYLTREQITNLWNPYQEAKAKLREGYHYDHFTRPLIAVPPFYNDRPGNAIWFDPAVVDQYPNHQLSHGTITLTELGTYQLVFVDEAVKYAQENWASDLLTIPSVHCLHISLLDPTKLSKEGYPNHVATVWCGLSKTPKQIRESGEKLLSQVIDETIVFLDLINQSPSGFDDVTYWEFHGANRLSTSTMRVCAQCGYGLSYARCKQCNVHFAEYTGTWRTWTHPSVPPKVVEFLASKRITFPRSPTHAWVRESLELTRETTQWRINWGDDPIKFTISF